MSKKRLQPTPQTPDEIIPYQTNLLCNKISGLCTTDECGLFPPIKGDFIYRKCSVRMQNELQKDLCSLSSNYTDADILNVLSVFTERINPQNSFIKSGRRSTLG